MARKYEIEALLARGSGASVFLAREPNGGRRVALKIGDGAEGCPQQAARRLGTELAMTMRVEHPHVARVLDHDLESAQPWIAREFLPGPHLGEHVPRTGLPWKRAAAIAYQLAQALAAVHAAGVLHRDIKASNVLMAANGLWKLTDFDVACERAAADDGGTFAGTPGFVAPELIRGRPATEASEVYALGAVLYLMIAGRLPFGDCDGLESMRRCLEEEPPRPGCTGGALPESLEELVMAALSRRPDRRPQSMAFFATRLFAVMTDPAGARVAVAPEAPADVAPAAGAPERPVRVPRVTKRVVASPVVAARASRAISRMVGAVPLPRRLPRQLIALAVCLLIVGCGLLLNSGTLISASPANMPFRAMREAAARTMAMAAGFGVPAQALKSTF